jgi:hypothetical protein
MISAQCYADAPEVRICTLILLECPPLFVPVDVRELGLRGALNGTREEAFAGS